VRLASVDVRPLVDYVSLADVDRQPLRLGEVVAVLERRLAVVADVVEDVLRLVEAAGVGHRQDGLDVGLAVDLVHPPARERLRAAGRALAERQLAVWRPEEDLAEPLDALGEGQLVHLGEVDVELLIGKLRDGRGGEEAEDDGQHGWMVEGQKAPCKKTTADGLTLFRSRVSEDCAHRLPARRRRRGRLWTGGSDRGDRRRGRGVGPGPY